MVSVEPLNASGGMIALTREPSARRASTSGEDSSIRRPTRETMRSMTRRRCSSEVKPAPVRCSLPLLLDVDVLRPVDHDLADRRVVEQALQRAEAEHVVGQLGGEAGPFLAAERDVLLLDDLVELAEHDGAQLVRAQARVVHPAAHALEERLAHPVLEAGEGVGRRRGRRGGGGRTRNGDGGRRGADVTGRPWAAAARRSARYQDAARCLAPVAGGLHERGRGEARHEPPQLLDHGVAPAAALQQRHALVGRQPGPPTTAAGRRRRRCRSSSRRRAPTGRALGSAKFMTTCRPAGIMHSSRSTSSSLRSPRTPGTSMLLSITTSVARSSAASVCCESPGAVSTTT